MVYVVDAIMGSGKTTAAINYINSHIGEKIIYVTPYSNETARIQQSCRKREFAIPSEIASAQHNGKPTKYSDLVRLVADGRNIATTHSLYRRCDPSLLAKIKEQGYTLIIDENIDNIEGNKLIKYGDIYNNDSLMANNKDMLLLLEAGYLIKKEEFLDGPNRFAICGENPDKKYEGAAFVNVFRKGKAQNILVFLGSEENEETYADQFFWSLRSEVINSFDKVFIMTYLFEYQGLYNLMVASKISYTTIGITKQNNELVFNFGDQSKNYFPEWTRNLDSLINILDNENLNAIGNDNFALSISWFTKNKNNCVDTARKNLKNVFTNYFVIPSDTEQSGGRNVRNKRRLWGSCMKGQEMLKGKGYISNFLPFNARATNEYKDADCLAYMVNVFVNGRLADIYKKMGIPVNEGQYALSTMIQWIWRSAIRDGKPIRIYIPSKRMRDLLIKWIEDLKNGGTGRCVTAETVGGSGRTSVTKKREAKTAATNQ